MYTYIYLYIHINVYITLYIIIYIYSGENMFSLDVYFKMVPNSSLWFVLVIFIMLRYSDSFNLKAKRNINNFPDKTNPRFI